jgi:protein SCO1/2
MGAQFQRLQSDLSSAGLLKKVQLLSLTFDPANDHPPALAKYLSRFGALEGHWQAARFDEDEDLARALVDLGVVVIPDESVGFIHNAAFYLVENGRVVEIFNVDARDALYKSIVRRLTG